MTSCTFHPHSSIAICSIEYGNKGNRDHGDRLSSRWLNVCQGNETSSSARIRDNQRRSRTRRKELIEDLQKRIQTYEQNGVTATQDMQRAARKVAQENLRLRSILAHHGISQEKVDIYLRSFDENQVSSDISTTTVRIPVSCPNVVSETVPVYGLGAAESSSHTKLADHRHITSHSFGPQHLEEHQTQERLDTANQSKNVERIDKPPVYEISPSSRVIDNPHDYENNARLDDTGCLNTPNCFCPPTVKPKTQPSTSGMVISCETAANIIIEMRGDGDVESVRKSLGCAGREECSVKNSTVMQVMDER
jgi:hypothetical protein